MSVSSDELEEVKNLGRRQLAAIVWPVRAPKDATFINEISNHIKIKFNEHTPGKFNQELNDFSNLRNVALSCLNEASLRDANSLKALKKYYCQLASMLTRFKDCEAEFSWKDSFGRTVIDGNIEFEINNVMYNIAAIHNELGAKITRNNESSTKEACSHFSSAAWWVKELRDNRGGCKPKEMSHDLLSFYFYVLQAQAQECVLSYSITAGMRPENVSKIAAQLATDYEIALRQAQTPLYTDPLKEILNSTSIFHGWRATVDFKHKFFSAMTYFLAGIANRDDDAKQIAIRIARLRRASHYIEQCKPLISDTVDKLASKACFENLDNLLSRKRDKAVRYNDNVYHSIIPSDETLPPIDGKLLVEPPPFTMSSIPEFQDLFSSLVTIESVQVNSIYSQKKDDLSRDIKSRVEKQDEELAQMMSSLNFNKNSLHLGEVETPDELIDICAELSMNPTIVDDVLTKLEELDDRSEEIYNSLQRVQEMLRKRPNKQYEDELKRFMSTHEEALRSTQALHRQLTPELQQRIQQLSTTSDPLELLPKLADSSENEEVIRRLERLLDKVDDMKQQRASLLAQLCRSIEQDDVIKHVVAASSEQELKGVFDKEIQKHDKYLNPLLSNLKLQDDMLDTLERVNAQYGQIKLNQRAQRATYSERVDSYKKFYIQFKEISNGIKQGLEYHNKMLDLVRKFHSKVQATNDLNDLLN